jgi:two-component system capsular synthesis response regulator RcsB
MSYNRAPLRVVIADDHPLVLLAMEKSLSEAREFTVVGAASCGEELLQLLATGEVDMVVTDFVMSKPGAGSARDDGFPLLAFIRRQYPDIPIVVFSMVSNGGVLSKIVDMGVQAIVGKDEAAASLLSICRRLASGHKPPLLSPSIAERLGTSELPQAKVAGVLSKKELEVVRLFASGLSLTDIAKRLNRAITTVATQKQSAMKKLNMQSNADLIRYATAEGLV